LPEALSDGCGAGVAASAGRILKPGRVVPELTPSDRRARFPPGRRRKITVSACRSGVIVSQVGLSVGEATVVIIVFTCAVAYIISVLRLSSVR
jgi:hypothetical protein